MEKEELVEGQKPSTVFPDWKSMMLQKRKRNNEPPEINEILELKASCKRNVGLK